MLTTFLFTFADRLNFIIC